MVKNLEKPEREFRLTGVRFPQLHCGKSAKMNSGVFTPASV